MIRSRETKYLSVEDAEKPTQGAEVWLDHWWIVDPEKGLIFYHGYAPQCNSDKRITDAIEAKGQFHGEVKQIPIVYIPRHLQNHDHA
jgi:hypothetical protein